MRKLLVDLIAILYVMENERLGYAFLDLEDDPVGAWCNVYVAGVWLMRIGYQEFFFVKFGQWGRKWK